MIFWAALIFLAVLTGGLAVAFARETRAAGRRQRAWHNGELLRGTLSDLPQAATGMAATKEAPVDFTLTRTSSGSEPARSEALRLSTGAGGRPASR